MSKRDKTKKKGISYILLELFLLILVSSIIFIVIYSAMQEGNHKRRIIVPEALDAPYRPYRPIESIGNANRVTPMDSMMRDVYVVQREINQGSHQLYLFFDTFTHRPARLDLKHFDLKNPKDAQWYNFAVYLVMFLLVAFPTISAFVAKFFFNKRVKDRSEWINKTVRNNMGWIDKTIGFIMNYKILIVFIVFMIAILLSMVNLSIPLEKEFEYRADPFFVFICFSSLAVAVISLKYVLKGLKKIKIGGETSLSGKSNFRKTLFWSALGIWAMGFMCYFIGMYSLGTQKSALASIVRPALESGKMFVLSDSVKEISFTLRNNGAFMGFYTICKLGFLLVSSFALVSLVWSRIVSYSTIRKRSIDPGDLYIFFGINENSKILAHDVAQRLRIEIKKKAEESKRLKAESAKLAEESSRLKAESEKLTDESKKKADESEKKEEKRKRIERNQKWDGAINSKGKNLDARNAKRKEKCRRLDEESKNLKKESENLSEKSATLAQKSEELLLQSKKKDDESQEMAEESRNHWTIVMVENRNNPVEGMGNGMTISSLIGMFNFRKDAYAETRDIDKKALLVVSDSAIGSRECSEQIEEVRKMIDNGEEPDKETRYDLFNSLGLKNLSKMIKNAKPHKCHFFFLDEDARTNIDATDNLKWMLKIAHPGHAKSTIYCLARNNAFSSLLERTDSKPSRFTDNETNIKILDLAVMAAQSLFMNPDNHPINFVDYDTETATVKSRFDALILGFGRSGRDIVRYLYEFSAFLDHDKLKEGKVVRSPFQCTIMDKDNDVIRPRYLAKIPAVKAACKAVPHDEEKGENDPLRFETAAINSDRFVTLIDEKLENKNMNFVVINMGSDKANMGALTYLVDQAMRNLKGNLGKLKIFVRSYDPTYEDALNDQAKHYNQLLNNNVVNIFGRRSDLLSYDMIVVDQIIDLAKDFHKNYTVLKDESQAEKDKDELWALRRNERLGNNFENDDDNCIKWKHQNRILRQETQDIHNGIHIYTKLKLIGLEYRQPENTLYEQIKQQPRIKQLIEEQVQDLVRVKQKRFKKRNPEFEGIDDDKYNQTLELLEQEAEQLIPFSGKDLIQLLKDRITYTKNENAYDIPWLKNLARNEHLRWVASLEMLGYTTPNDEQKVTMTKCDEVAKIHPGMVDWNEESNLFDFQLIDSSFKLAEKVLDAQEKSFIQARKEALEKALNKAIIKKKKKIEDQANQKNQKSLKKRGRISRPMRRRE